MIRFLLCAFLLPLTLAALVPGRGIPETLATERAASIRALRYELSFRIPADKSEAIAGTAVVRFQLRTPQTVVLDFEQKRESILSVQTGGKTVPFEFTDGHIIIPASALHAGENELNIRFLAGNESLNRNDDFLYTLFVPARRPLRVPVLRPAQPEGPLFAHLRHAR